MSDSEQLAETIEVARANGYVETMWTWRCQGNRSQRCLIVGWYQIRGKTVVLAGPTTVSPTLATSLGLGSERVRMPRRAWLESDVPTEPVIVGCRHETYKLIIRADRKPSNPERLRT